MFSRKSYLALSNRDRDIIDAARYRNGRDGKYEPDDLHILEDGNGCVPQDEVGEDLLLDIRRKFDIIYGTATRLAERKAKKPPYTIDIVIDSSFEDRTCVVIYHQKQVLYDYSAKAWNVHFDSLKAVVSEISRVRDNIVSQLETTAI